MKRIFVISVIIIFCLCGCGTDSKLNSDGTIDYVYAKELMINENAILVDVRSEEEYNEGHIDGALLLPVDSINEDSASEVIESKDSTVIVYCRSGNRSSQALQILNDLGYENVYDLGAMSNWEE